MSRRRLHVLSHVLCGCLPVVFLIGCGSGDGLERRAIFGTVANADPRASELPVSGSISFRPAAGVAGPSANTGVDKGSFRFDDETGPVAGPHRVVIQLNFAKPGLTKDPLAQTPKSAPGIQTRWEFDTVVPDDGSLELNFALE